MSETNTHSLLLFRVRESVEDAQPDVDGDVVAWGVQFPSGLCYVDWNQQHFPQHQRYEDPHISMYGSLSDCKQAMGGFLETVYAEPISNN